MAFPTSLDSFTTKVNSVDDVSASHINGLQTALVALETKLGIDASAVATSIDFLRRKGYVKVSEVVASGGAGGGISATTWTKRPFNTEDLDPGSLCSLSSNQITLSAGTYDCLISVPGFNCGEFYSRLYNVTADSMVLQGQTTSCATSQSVTSISLIRGRFTIAASQALEIQMYSTSSKATNGMGYPIGAGNNVYAVAEFWKLY